MAGGITWREFECIVARLQKTYAKNGKVTTDEKIRGRHSKRLRQIDICVRVDVAGEELLVVVECKKWNKKPNVKDVESFLGMMDDVKAHAGIMISTEGFTKSAMNLTESHRLSLYKYRDTETEGWPNGIVTKAFLEIWELTPTIAVFVLTDGTHEAIETDEGLNFISVRDGTNGPMATALRLLWDASDENDKKEGTWTVTVPTTCPDRAEISSIVLGADCKLVRGFRPGRLHFEGLVNERAGYANVESWKMLFDGNFVPASAQGKAAPSRTTCILLKSTYVHTQSQNSRALLDWIISGVLEVSLAGNGMMKLPLYEGDYSKYIEFGKINASDFKVTKRANRQLFMEAPIKRGI